MTARRARTRRESRGKRRPRPAGSRVALFLMAALPGLLALGVFANTVTDTFVYDDLLRFDQLSSSAPPITTLLRQSRGLTYLFHYMDKALWEDWRAGFHLTNVLLHSIASALVACAAFTLSRSRRVALACGLFFAVHPVHVEAVASFVNRKDVLAMIFVALTVILWHGKNRPLLRYLAALACFALALFAKEVAAVGLVGMLFIMDALPLPQSSPSWRLRLRRATLRSLPFALGGVLFTIRFAGNLTLAFSPEAVHQRTGLQLRTYEQVLANVLASVPEQFRLLFFPLKLSADYGVSPETELTSPEALFGLVLAISWIVLAVLLAKKAPLASFAMAWTVVTFLPCSNLVPLIHFFVAERYLYVPSFGFCLLLGLAFERGLSWAKESGRSRTRLAVFGLLAALILGGGVRSTLRNREWRDARSLWESSLHAGHKTQRVYHNLGEALLREGRRTEAVPYLLQALQGGPVVLGTRQRLIVLLLKAGATGEVDRECRSLLRDFPGEWECHAYLGDVAVRQGDPAAARAHYEEALKAQPEHPAILRQLTWLYASRPQARDRDLTEALAVAERARQVTGGADPAVLYSLALLRAEAGDLGPAVDWARQAYALAQAQGRTDLARQVRPVLRRLAFVQHRQRSTKPPRPSSEARPGPPGSP